LIVNVGEAAWKFVLTATAPGVQPPVTGLHSATQTRFESAGVVAMNLTFAAAAGVATKLPPVKFGPPLTLRKIPKPWLCAHADPSPFSVPLFTGT